MNRLQYSLIDRAVSNNESAIQLLLAEPPDENRSSHWVQLFNDGKDSVWIDRAHWGLLELITAKTYYKSLEITKHAFTGSDIPQELGLYITDTDKQLSVAGNTALKGTIAIPDKGVKSVYIEGKGSSPITNGAQLKSSKTLPALDPEILISLNKIITNRFLDADSVVLWTENLIDDSLHRSFSKKTLVFYSNQKINLNHYNISGNICIVSDKEIIINRNTSLNDVLLIASKIFVEEKCAFTAQLFARDSIVIGNEAHLVYPSVACVFKKNKNFNEHGGILLKEKSTIDGLLLAYDENTSDEYSCEIRTESENNIKGIVYCNTSCDIRGDVTGVLMTKNVTVKTATAVYENHLMDFKFNSRGLSSFFLIPPVFIQNQFLEKKILKWVY